MLTVLQKIENFVVNQLRDRFDFLKSKKIDDCYFIFSYLLFYAVPHLFIYQIFQLFGRAVQSLVRV